MAATELSFVMNKNEFLQKYVNNKSLYIIIIIGVLLMLFSGGREPETGKNARGYAVYSDEARLEEILSKIKGAGEVSVMITYYGTTSFDLAYESKSDASSSDKGTQKSVESAAITSGGDPMVKGEIYPKARGVVIIAEGANISSVKKAITDAASAALEIASYRVCVLEGS